MNSEQPLCHNISEQALPLSPGTETATDLAVERASELVMRLVKLKGGESVPFLAEEFADMLGIEVKKEDLGIDSPRLRPLGALLLRRPNGYVIKVNSSQSWVRQNYSCAHEIGHVILDEMERVVPTNDTEFRMSGSDVSREAKERLCEAVAAELLMPQWIFQKYLSCWGASVTSAEWLAHTFKVSIPAAAIRVAELSEEPCMVIRWKRLPRGRTKVLEADWCFGPGKEKHNGYYGPVVARVRYPSSLFKAYEGELPVKSTKLFRLGSIKKPLHLESKGFLTGDNRYVISLAFPERQKTS